MDEGAIGLPMANWMDCFVGTRGSTCEDPHHRYFNDLREGLVSVGRWIFVCERTVLYNLPNAPFGKHGFFSMVKEASQEDFAWRITNCPIFQSL
jgi:hypothetical protein